MKKNMEKERKPGGNYLALADFAPSIETFALRMDLRTTGFAVCS
jgi:hypothetical protein